MIIPVKYGDGGYDIVVRRGCLYDSGEYIKTTGRTLIVTDDGVPEKYAQALARGKDRAHIMTLPQGEESKSLDNYARICKELLGLGFERGDAVIAVGGGVVGDISGFAASTYMRGIAFYNVPTTLLSQVDSSVGGKTAVDFCGVKNIIGSFYRPSGVLIDPDVLDTLPNRQLVCGMCEALKMAVTSDKDLFSLFEDGSVCDMTEEIIIRSLKIKSDIVSRDEKESGLRRILNFGHTVGHGIEAASGGELLHGECVGLGMICMSGEDLSGRLKKILCGLGAPTSTDIPAEKIISYAKHDKKASGGEIKAVFSETPGEYSIRGISDEELMIRIKRITDK